MRKLILGVLLSFDLIYSDSCFFFQLVDVVFLRLVVESACFLFSAFVDKECRIVIIDFSTCSCLFDSSAMMRKLILGVLVFWDNLFWVLLFLYIVWFGLVVVVAEKCRINSSMPFSSFVNLCKKCCIIIVDFSTSSKLFDGCSLMRKFVLGVRFWFSPRSGKVMKLQP